MQTSNIGINYGAVSGDNYSQYTNVGNTYNINVYTLEKGYFKVLQQRITDLERLLLEKEAVINAKDMVISLLQNKSLKKSEIWKRLPNK